MYCSVEYFMDGVGKNIQISKYDPETLEFPGSMPFNEESGQLECSGIAVNPQDSSVAMVSWLGEKNGRYIYEYDLKTGQMKRKIHLQPAPQWVQGIVWHDGNCCLTADDGTADGKEPDHLCRASILPEGNQAAVPLERTFDDVKMQGEIEGLAFDPKQVSFCSCTTGARESSLDWSRGSLRDMAGKSRKLACMM